MLTASVRMPVPHLEEASGMMVKISPATMLMASLPGGACDEERYLITLAPAART